MHRPPHTIHGIIFLLACLLLPAAGAAQVADSAGQAPPPGLPDTVAAAGGDTAAPADTMRYMPLGGVGSIAAAGLPVPVLDDSAMEFIPFRTTGDLLGPLGGVFVSETGVGGFRRKFSVHGLRDGALSFLADGLLLNDPSTGMYDAGGYPAGNAGALEFAPPPLGFVHGPGAAGGTIDLVSHSRRAPRALSGVRYSQSAYGFSFLDGFLSRDIVKGLNASLGLERPVSDGRFGNSALDAWGGRIKLRYDIGGAAVYVSDIFHRRERGLNDGISFATPESLRYEPIRAIVVNPSAAEKVVRHDLGVGGAIGGDGSSLTSLDLELTSAHREYRDEAGDTGSAGAPFREVRDEQSTGLRIGHTREIAGNRLTVGAEVRSRRLLADPNIGSFRSTQIGIFGAIVVNAGRLLSVSPAARLDRFLDRRRLSAGAALRLRVTERISVTGGISRSHRFPSFAEAYGVGGLADPLDAPDPERHDVITAGIFAGDSAGSFAALTIFHRKVSGTITLDSSGAPGGPPASPPLAWLRTGDESRSGASFAAALTAGSLLAEVNAGCLSYGAGARRRYAPAWDVTGGIYFRDRFVGGHLDLKAGFRGRYFSGYDGEGYSQRYELFVPSGYDIPPAGTLDFVLFAGIGDAVIHLIWENLLDRRYVMAVFYPADDRAVRFGLTWDFLD